MADGLPEPEQLAKFFHEKYERLALEMGYETRVESRRAWENVPEKNRRLMVATAERVLDFLRFGLDRATLDAVVPVPGQPQGKLVLTRKGFAELARRGLVRCRACESWNLNDHGCNEPKLNADVSDHAPDGIGFGDYPFHDPDFGPDFGCIHFQPKDWSEHEQVKDD